MAGTRAGGRKAAITNKARYGDDFYVKRGRSGGKVSRGGGFAADRDRASWAGRKGGAISRRTTESYKRGIENTAEEQREVIKQALAAKQAKAFAERIKATVGRLWARNGE